jgi:nucleoside 2-deoxyribosyltransferase
MSAVYVGSSLHNAQRVREVQQRFRDVGIDITYDWTTHGQIFDEALLAEVGELEEKGVRDCDVFFMLHPARNGTHYEMGLAKGLNKLIVMVAEQEVEKKTFYYTSGIVKFTNLDEAIEFVKLTLRERP